MKETLWLFGIHPKPYNDSQEWVPVPRAQRPSQGLYGYDSLPKKQNLFSRYNGLQRLHGATAKKGNIHTSQKQFVMNRFANSNRSILL